jgi:hypothetical protein
MATKFNLTAQLVLQAPRNTSQVVSEIQRQLSGVNVPINVTNSGRSNQQLAQVENQTRKVTTQAQKMGKSFGIALRRFTAFSVAAKGVTLFTSALSSAIEESIEFQREVIKISQVTGKTVSELRGLVGTINDLSTSLGVSSKSLLSTGRILSQAGIQARELDVALTALAKTTLAPTFEDITKTTEGAVAIIAQFKEGVGALERQLGSINAVAGQFAVESGDLISAVRRTGGVFKAAGGDLEELLALFTSVRATTRESSESIATGLRTIFTRIQRPRTIEFLKQYGVELTDLEGKFVGPYEAVRRLSDAFGDLEEGDITFVKVAEELGGFRQIGKVIPLIKEFNTAERARQAALEGGDSLTRDAASAQLALAIQIQKVKEEFYELVRAITETSTFQAMVKVTLNFASALIKVADAIKPLIPLIGAFAGFKLIKGIGGFAAGIGAGLRGTRGFNSGGLVPGTGNRDTVPAMLTPGEFVIRKSSVQSIGTGNLAAMNAKGYASGGIVDLKNKPAKTKFINKDKTIVGMDKDRYTMPDSKDLAVQISKNSYQKLRGGGKGWEEWLATKSKLPPKHEERPKGLPSGELKLNRQTGYPVDFVGEKSGRIYDAKDLREGSISDEAKAKKSLNYAFIKALGASWRWSGRPQTTPRKYEDEKFGTSSKKLSPNADQIKLQPLTLLYPKIVNKDGEKLPTGTEQAKRTAKRAKRRATGGGVSGSDTVPAMLTPGEFVFSKKAAQSIGYSNLNRMNTQGVQGFAKGGVVDGVQKFAGGGTASPSSSASSASSGLNEVGKSSGTASKGLSSIAGAGFILTSALEMMRPQIDENSGAFAKLTDTVISTASQIAIFGTLAAGLIGKDAIKSLGKGAIGSAKKLMGGKGPDEVKVKGRGSAKPELDEMKALSKSMGENRKYLKETRTTIADLTKKNEALRKTIEKAESIAASAKKEKDSATTKTSGQKKARGAKNKQDIDEKRAKAENKEERARKVANEGKASLQANEARLSNFKEAEKVQSSDLLEQEKEFENKGQKARGKKGGTRKRKGTSLKRTIQTGTKRKVSSGVRSIDKVINPNIRKSIGGKIAQGGGRLTELGGRVGGKAGGAISKVGGLATRGGQLAAGSAGQIGAAAGTAATALASFAAVAGTAVAVTGGLAKIMDEVSGVHIKAKKAIEEGNVAQAGTAAVSSRLQKDANNLAMGMAATGAAVGQVLIPIPILGAAIGGLVGGIGGLFAKTEAGEKAMGVFRDKVLTAFGADSTSLIKKRAEVEAQAVKAQKEFSENAKEASRALEDVEAGTTSFKEAFESGRLTGNAKNQAQLAIGQRDLAQAESDKVTSRSGLASVLTLGFLGSSGAEKQAAKDSAVKAEEEKRKALNKVIDENRNNLNNYGRSLIVSGDASAATLDNFKQKVAEQLGVSVDEIDPKTLADLETKFVRNAKEIAANTRAFAASTVGVQGLSNYANGASAEMANITSVLDGSFNSVKNSSDLLASSLSGAQISDKSFDSALNNLTAGFEDFGIEQGSIDKIRGNVTALRGVTGNFQSAIGDVAKEVSAAGGDIEPQDFKGKILDALADSAPAGQEQFVKDFFGGIDFDPKDIEKSLKGDFSGIMKTLGDQAGEGFKEVQEASNAVSSAQQALVNVTRQRIESERAFIQAQQENIGLQQEAAQALSDFGIDTLTTSEKVEFAQKKLATSFDGRSLGGAGDIQAEIRGIQSQATSAIVSNRGALTGQGPQGTDFAANADLVAKSQEQLNATIEYSRTRIALYKEELDIVRKKNQAEKDSLDSLLSGDVESFIQGQQQAAAASALRSGDATAASLFSSKALGGALKDLRDQGVSGDQLERASSIALSSAGIQDQQSAQILAGTTDEEKAIMAGVEAEAQTLREAGAAKEAIASENLATAKLGETQAVNALAEAQANAAKAAATFAESLKLASKAADDRQKIADQAEKDNVQNITATYEEEKKVRQGKIQEQEQKMLDKGNSISGLLFGANLEEENAQIKKLEEEQKKADEAFERDINRAQQSYSNGGLVYAKNGFYAGAKNMMQSIFKPKGADTIPAMVQAGEFIVSKRGVQSGNNLNLLKMMNQGMSGMGQQLLKSSGLGSGGLLGALGGGGLGQQLLKSSGLSSGGLLGALGGGGLGFDKIGGILEQGASTLMKPAESILHAAEQLKNTLSSANVGMSVSPFSVNVNFNGASFLESLTDDIKSRVMSEVVEEMKKMAFDNSGNMKRKKGVL